MSPSNALQDLSAAFQGDSLLATQAEKSHNAILEEAAKARAEYEARLMGEETKHFQQIQEHSRDQSNEDHVITRAVMQEKVHELQAAINSSALKFLKVHGDRDKVSVP